MDKIYNEIIRKSVKDRLLSRTFVWCLLYSHPKQLDCTVTFHSGYT